MALSPPRVTGSPLRRLGSLKDGGPAASSPTPRSPQSPGDIRRAALAELAASERRARSPTEQAYVQPRRSTSQGLSPGSLRPLEGGTVRPASRLGYQARRTVSAPDGTMLGVSSPSLRSGGALAPGMALAARRALDFSPGAAAAAEAPGTPGGREGPAGPGRGPRAEGPPGGGGPLGRGRVAPRAPEGPPPAAGPSGRGLGPSPGRGHGQHHRHRRRHSLEEVQESTYGIVGALRERDLNRLRDYAAKLGAGRLNRPAPELGHTILHEAVIQGLQDMAAVLLERGADPNVGSQSQGPPLLHASFFGEKAIVRLLLEAGADTSLTDLNGYTALHYACQAGHVTCVRALLQAGASIRAKTLMGQTPLQLVTSEQVHVLFGQDIGGTSIPESPGAAAFMSQFKERFEKDYQLHDNAHRPVATPREAPPPRRVDSDLTRELQRLVDSPPQLRLPPNRAGQGSGILGDMRPAVGHARYGDDALSLSGSARFSEEEEEGGAAPEDEEEDSDLKKTLKATVESSMKRAARDQAKFQAKIDLFESSQEMSTGSIVWAKGEFLGEGAYGKVFAGLNQQSGELMGVKLIPIDMEDPHYHHRITALDKEVNLYKRLKHKHIIGYIASHVDYEEELIYIFLEYAPGGSIASMLERFGKFSESLVRHYTRQILIGLEHLHNCKIIHRDLKGANILISKEGHVKLADFGASKVFNERTLSDGFKSIHGSVYWMAPEVMKSAGYGRKADIWGVGCVVLEMLTGSHPWPESETAWAAMYHIAKSKNGPPLPDTLSPEARSFLKLCFEYDPDNRPSAHHLLRHEFVNKTDAAVKEAQKNSSNLHSL